MQQWERIEPTIITKVGWRTIVTKTFKMPDGQTATFDTKDGEGTRCIGTIALTPDNQVVIARQFRTGPEKVMDEIPGGGLEPGEDPATAATRELAEETGYKPGAIEHLGDVYKDAYTNCIWHYFLAKDCVQVSDQALDTNEHVDVALISIDELFSNAQTANMTDVEAVFLAYEKLQELRGVI